MLRIYLNINKVIVLCLLTITFFLGPLNSYAVMSAKASVNKNDIEPSTKFNSIIVKYKNKNSAVPLATDVEAKHIDYTSKKINEAHAKSSTTEIKSTPIELQHVQTLSNGSKVLKVKNFGALLRKVKNVVAAINRMKELAGQAPMSQTNLSQAMKEMQETKEADKLLREDLKKTLLQFKNDPNIEYAEPDYILRMTKVPDKTVTRYKDQWSYFDEKAGVNLPKAWDVTTGSEIVVAVLDSGIVQHNALKNKILSGRNFVTTTLIDGEEKADTNAATDPTDSGDGTEYHGTHVAGTIGAIGNVITGVSWGSKILPIRVLGAKGNGQVSAISEGLLWAAGLGETKPYPTKKAKILNLSLGEMAECGQTMQSAINKVVEAGAIVVVAAGNASSPAKNFMPANCDKVITVGATDSLGLRGYYSNYNVDKDDKTIKVLAPGGGNGFLDVTDGILSLGAAPDTYQYLSGTSMAAPHISGIIALMLSVNPNLKTQDVLSYLQKSAHGDVMDLGLVDANKALSLIPKPTTVTPTPAAPTPVIPVSPSPDTSDSTIIKQQNLPNAKQAFGNGSLTACYIKKPNSSVWNLALKNTRAVKGDCQTQMNVCSQISNMCQGEQYCCIQQDADLKVVDFDRNTRKCITK